MAGSKTGTPTIIRLSRKICRMRSVYGASDLSAKTSPEFAAAVAALALACAAFEALDNYPAEIDETAPFGVEDIEGI